MNKKLILIIVGFVVVAAASAGAVYYVVAAKRVAAERAQAEEQRHSLRYQVAGGSMDPTLKEGDWLLARTDVKAFSRGNLILMKYPADESKVLCRRILGIEGDKVVTKYYSNVKITTVFSEIHPGGVDFPSTAKPQGAAYREQEVTVAPGMVYVAGDNAVPGGSFDSDEWGTLPMENLVGMVKSRLEPDPRQF